VSGMMMTVAVFRELFFFFALILLVAPCFLPLRQQRCYVGHHVW
jgi:hypothetical protein